MIITLVWRLHILKSVLSEAFVRDQDVILSYVRSFALELQQGAINTYRLLEFCSFGLIHHTLIISGQRGSRLKVRKTNS